MRFNPYKLSTLLAGIVILQVATAAANRRVESFNIAKVERPRIIEKAAKYLDESPRTVTADICDRSEGGPHDYYSEGDYWWPDPKKPDGPYMRRDGQTNPDNFIAHRKSMIRLSDIIGTLASAWQLTHDEKYAAQAVKHLKAWFSDEKTCMNPSLLYGQAIKGRHSGRSIGVIDTIHLVEVARGAKVLCGSTSFRPVEQAAVKGWFREYLTWINTHPYGKQEKMHPNNHGVCWSLQAAAFSDLVGDKDQLAWIRRQFKEVYLKEMMDEKGGFPAELKRTKPYGYSLFVIDAMAGVAQIASVPDDDLWEFQLSDGRGMKRGMEFIAPFIEDKKSWPLKPDVMYWDEWPVRHPSLLFAGIKFGRQDYLETWKKLESDPQTYEVLRNLPIRHPLLWFEIRSMDMLITPPMTDDSPAAGRRVRQVAPEYKGTDVYHALYLPADWKPGGKYPVIVEYTGNKYPACGSTGRVCDANLGYGMSGGRGFIWVAMPYVEKGGKENAVTWWGDRDATVEYCKVNLPRICKEFGGDMDNLFVCGFSRGAIGSSYIGLADDEIASLWKGMFTHDHFDGERKWGYPECDRASALKRLARLKGRPVLVCGTNASHVRDGYLKDHLDLAEFTFLDVPVSKIFKIPEGKVIHPHTDRWMHKESEARKKAREWILEVIHEKR